MKQFRALVDAVTWLKDSSPLGKVSVVVHGDPYEANREEHGCWYLIRQYPSTFYLKENRP